MADKFSKAEENGLITINLAEIPLSIHEEEITANDRLIVYPNPATNELFLKVGLLQFENIRIYNVLGQLMINTPVNGSGGVIRIDLLKMSTGIYFVECVGKKEIKSAKFLKQ